MVLNLNDLTHIAFCCHWVFWKGRWWFCEGILYWWLNWKSSISYSLTQPPPPLPKNSVTAKSNMVVLNRFNFQTHFLNFMLTIPIASHTNFMTIKFNCFLCSLKRYNWNEYGPFEKTINYADINDQPHTILSLIWVDYLGVRFVVLWWVGVNCPPCLELVRSMLETWNLLHMYLV